MSTFVDNETAVMHEQLLASFVLDRTRGLEIALPADQVMEATTVTAPIQPLPNGTACLEGIMQLRRDVIPVINMKTRLGLESRSYDEEAKVAVVELHGRRYGLLFDDIRDVLRVPSTAVMELDGVLLGEDRIISSLVVLDDASRSLELLDLGHLFPGGSSPPVSIAAEAVSTEKKRYSQYVVFSCLSQEYGIPVEDAREICFLTDIDDMFKSGEVEGALELRGYTIPVLSAAHLLLGKGKMQEPGETTRVLVMRTGDLMFGVIVDQVKEILLAADDAVLPVPDIGAGHILGVYQRDQRNIMLLNVLNLIESQMETIKAMARRKQREGEEAREKTGLASRHIITENCYLVFSIGRHFAIELKDVQEIIDTADTMALPEGSGLTGGIINLRGSVVPVLDLHDFYRCPARGEESAVCKLIIGRSGAQRVALAVDEIVTIYKQEQFFETPSLRPELQDRKDTLDRLIEYHNEEGLKEHVLVVNVENVIVNHLKLDREAGPGD